MNWRTALMFAIYYLACQDNGSRGEGGASAVQGGAFAGPSSGKNYEGEVTTYVIIACIVAASGGALFGYAIIPFKYPLVALLGQFACDTWCAVDPLYNLPPSLCMIRLQV